VSRDKGASYALVQNRCAKATADKAAILFGAAKSAAYNPNTSIAIGALIHVKTPQGASFRVTG
jgi:hypothetical protein